MSEAIAYDKNLIEEIFHPTSKDFIHNSAPTYKRMLKECPVAWYSPWAAWVVSPHKLCEQGLKDARLSSNFMDWEYAPPPKPESEKNDFDYMFEDQLITATTENHLRLRRLTLPAFSKRVMYETERKIEGLIVETFDDIGDTGQFDVFSQIATKLPARCIARMLGVPRDREVLFEGLAAGIGATVNPALTNERRQLAIDMTLPGIAMVKEVLADRRATDDPEDDFLGTLIKTRDSGDRLSDQEIVGLIGGLLGAGGDTVVDLHTYTIFELLNNHNEYQLLLEHPELTDNAIFEILRHGSPGKTGIHRYALEDVEIGGQMIRKGQQIIFSISAAHYDTEKYPNPERFDIQRNFKGNLLFGNGSHHCIGINLAKTQAKMVIREFSRRFPNATLASNPEYDYGHHNTRRINRLIVDTNL